MFAEGHLLTQLIPQAENFDNLVILLTWIRIDQILWIRIQIESIRIHITALKWVSRSVEFT